MYDVNIINTPNIKGRSSRNFLIFKGSSSGEVEFGSAKFYGLCGVGGILSCGITHTAIVPLDLVKCRIQVRMHSSLYFIIFWMFKKSMEDVLSNNRLGRSGQVQRHYWRLQGHTAGGRRPRIGERLGTNSSRLFNAGLGQIRTVWSVQKCLFRNAWRGKRRMITENSARSIIKYPCLFNFFYSSAKTNIPESLQKMMG